MKKLIKKVLQFIGGYNYKKYGNYPVVKSAEGMLPFVIWIKEWSKLRVNNIFEIGANFAQDADFLMKKFSLTPDKVYVFEAHPEIFKAITKIHKFNAYNYAVFDEEKEMKFNIIPLSYKNSGISSLNKSIYSAGTKVETSEVSVQSIRMDNFMEKNCIDKIDFLKLDVEGVNYEVLQGFGKRIADINCIHVEAEHIKDFYGDDVKLFDDIANLLTNHDFELIYFQRYTSQSDSFWIKKEFIKKHRLEV